MASPAPSSGSTNVGLAPNVAGLLCYMPCCIGLLFSIVCAIIEKQSKFVRFHAFQSLVLQGAFIVVGFILGIFFTVLGHMFPVMGGILNLVVNIVFGFGGLALTVWLMIKAYGGEEWEIPGIGPLVRGWI